jgi:hypothetical protein
MVNFLTSIGLDGATILQKSWHGGKPKPTTIIRHGRYLTTALKYIRN